MPGLKWKFFVMGKLIYRKLQLSSIYLMTILVIFPN